MGPFRVHTPGVAWTLPAHQQLYGTWAVDFGWEKQESELEVQDEEHGPGKGSEDSRGESAFSMLPQPLSLCLSCHHPECFRFYLVAHQIHASPPLEG